MTIPICKCGAELEEGFMGVLWCPNCEGDWEMPDGATPETHPEYYMTITIMTEDEVNDVKDAFGIDKEV